MKTPETKLIVFTMGIILPLAGHATDTAARDSKDPFPRTELGSQGVPPFEGHPAPYPVSKERYEGHAKQPQLPNEKGKTSSGDSTSSHDYKSLASRLRALDEELSFLRNEVLGSREYVENNLQRRSARVLTDHKLTLREVERGGTGLESLEPKVERIEEGVTRLVTEARAIAAEQL